MARDGPPGFYAYTLNLTNVPANLQVTGQWATDNPGAILINGVEVSENAGWNDNQALMTDQRTYSYWTPFSLAFATGGSYTLQFEVYNIPAGGGNPTGINVQFAGNTAGGGVIPEASTLAMWSVLSLVGLVLTRRGCARELGVGARPSTA